MADADTFLAVFTGSKTNPRSVQAWMAMRKPSRKAKMQEGIAAWHGWMDKHCKPAVVLDGGLLGG